jgi:hypothetical protein
MKAKLKRLHSPDIDLATFFPEEPDNFGFLLQAMIGPDNQEGEESFDIQICTPKWLQSRYSESEVLFGYHHLIVFEYDLRRIENTISKYCDGCTGVSWQEIARKLSRIGHWEFEDYIPA